MAMYMCSICGEGVSSGENHKCKPIPLNVLNNKHNSSCSHDRKISEFCYECWKECGGNKMPKSYRN